MSFDPPSYALGKSVSGGGSTGSFKVTFTLTDGADGMEGTCDKTIDEVEAAVTAGKNLEVVFLYGTAVMTAGNIIVDTGAGFSLSASCVVVAASDEIDAYGVSWNETDGIVVTYAEIVTA